MSHQRGSPPHICTAIFLLVCLLFLLKIELNFERLSPFSLIKVMECLPPRLQRADFAFLEPLPCRKVRWCEEECVINHSASDMRARSQPQLIRPSYGIILKTQSGIRIYLFPFLASLMSLNLQQFHQHLYIRLFMEPFFLLIVQILGAVKHQCC